MYRSFYVLVAIDGIAKSFDAISGVNIDSVLADLREAFAGDVRLIQYRQN